MVRINEIEQNRQFVIEFEVTQNFTFYIDGEDASAQIYENWVTDLYQKLCTMFDNAPEDKCRENHIVPEDIAYPIDRLIFLKSDRIQSRGQFNHENFRLLGFSEEISDTTDKPSEIEVEPCFHPGYIYR